MCALRNIKCKVGVVVSQYIIKLNVHWPPYSYHALLQQERYNMNRFNCRHITIQQGLCVAVRIRF